MYRRSFVAAAAGGAITLHTDARSILGRALRRVEGISHADAAQDEDFWFTVREAFTVDRNLVNLNNGSVAPSPKTVQQAQRDYLTITNMQPSYYVDEMLYPGFDTIRRRLAAGFGCDPEEIAITRNTTEALEIVQLGMPLQRGDEVLTTTQDYPSMLTTWRQRARRDGITLRTISYPVPPNGQDDLFHRIEQAIGPRTKVIHISHITFTTGQIFPVKRICQMARQRGIEVVVDGGHSFAQFPFTRDDLDCDSTAPACTNGCRRLWARGFCTFARRRFRVSGRSSPRQKRWPATSGSSRRSVHFRSTCATLSPKRWISTSRSVPSARPRGCASSGAGGRVAWLGYPG